LIDNPEQLIETYKQLEEIYETWIATRKQAYILQWQVRSTLKSIKSPLSVPYVKYSRDARHKARKLLGKKRGYEVEHKVALKLLWAMGVSIEEANDLRNLCHLKKKENRRKSFRVDWEVFEQLYKDKVI